MFCRICFFRTFSLLKRKITSAGCCKIHSAQIHINTTLWVTTHTNESGGKGVRTKTTQRKCVRKYFLVRVHNGICWNINTFEYGIVIVFALHKQTLTKSIISVRVFAKNYTRLPYAQSEKKFEHYKLASVKESFEEYPEKRRWFYFRLNWKSDAIFYTRFCGIYLRSTGQKTLKQGSIISLAHEEHT